MSPTQGFGSQLSFTFSFLNPPPPLPHPVKSAGWEKDLHGPFRMKKTLWFYDSLQQISAAVSSNFRLVLNSWLCFTEQENSWCCKAHPRKRQPQRPEQGERRHSHAWRSSLMMRRRREGAGCVWTVKSFARQFGYADNCRAGKLRGDGGEGCG